MRYEIRVNLNDETRDPEDSLVDVVNCTAFPEGMHYDSADIDASGVVTMSGSVVQPVKLAQTIGSIRLINWGRVTIERTV
jgi:hypothetical protein